MRAIVLIFALLISVQLSAQVKVKGYYRKDGTYVKPHYRSNPDGNPYNNWSYPGNTNPYTGKTATGNPDTYLNNYYNPYSNSPRSSSSSSSNSSKPSFDRSHSSYSELNNYYVTTNSLKVRSGSSTSHSVIGSLSKADKVTVIKSYSNGWKKIRYTQNDNDPIWPKTQTGYIDGSYLSTYRPYINNAYSNSNPFLSHEYTGLERETAPLDLGKGNLTIWTNCGTDGEIEIYLDGNYIGTLTKYFRVEGSPDCEEDGTLSINKPAGTYTLEGIGNQYSWLETINITENRCLIHQLTGP